MKKLIILSLICCICILVVGCENNNIQQSESLNEITSITTENISESIESTNHNTSEIKIWPFQQKEFGFDNFQDVIYEDTYDLSFLNEDLQTKFYQAKFLAYQFVMFTHVCPMSLNQIKIKNELKNKDETQEYFYYSTHGMNYESFDNAVRNTFTNNYYKKIKDKKLYINIDGKLACQAGDGGYNISFRKIEFELISQDENKIEFKGTAYYSSEDINDTTIDYTETYIFKVINTENGWRFDTFPIWY